MTHLGVHHKLKGCWAVAKVLAGQACPLLHVSELQLDVGLALPDQARCGWGVGHSAVILLLLLGPQRALPTLLWAGDGQGLPALLELGIGYGAWDCPIWKGVLPPLHVCTIKAKKKRG